MQRISGAVIGTNLNTQLLYPKEFIWLVTWYTSRGLDGRKHSDSQTTRFNSFCSLLSSLHVYLHKMLVLSLSTQTYHVASSSSAPCQAKRSITATQKPHSWSTNLGENPNHNIILAWKKRNCQGNGEDKKVLNQEVSAECHIIPRKQHHSREQDHSREQHHSRQHALQAGGKNDKRSNRRIKEKCARGWHTAPQLGRPSPQGLAVEAACRRACCFLLQDPRCLPFPVMHT